MKRRFLTLAACAVTALALVGCGRGKGTEAELVASARALLDKQDMRGAVIQLKNALQQNPGSASARLLLGKTLLDSGDPVAALVELTKAQELQVPDEEVVPAIARALLLTGDESKVVSQYAATQLNKPEAQADLRTTLASAYAGQGNVDQARQTAAEALRIQPGYAPAIILQARLDAAGGDLDGALALLDTVLAKEPGHERAGALKGDILWRGKNDPEAALTAFRQVATAHPTSVAALSSIVNILYQQNKLEQARTEFAVLKKTAPNHPETLTFEAQLAYSDKDFKAVRDITSRILKAMPNNLRVLELAGAAEYRMKQYLQAETLFAQAVKVAPKQLLARQMLAQTYLRSAQPAKAVELLQPIIESAQADGGSLALAGEAYLQVGDNKRSEDAFARAVKAAPNSAAVRTSAAVATLLRGGTNAAISELETIASGDDSPRADLALISARLRQKDIPGALKAIDALEKKQPDQPMPLNLRGRVLLLKQDYAGATRAFEAALVKDPAYFPSVASLAAIDLVGGKPDNARQRFEKFLQTQPKSYQAKLAIAELQARTGAPPDEVTKTVREAVKLNPSETGPQLVLIERLLGAKDDKGALAAAQEATAALPNDLQIMDALGRAQMLSGDLQRATSTFTKLSGLQPRNPTYELRLADVYVMSKDYAAAAASLRRALEIRPDLVAAQRGMAMLAVLDKRPQEGIEMARKLQREHPKDATGFTLEGDIESGRKNWDAAATAYRSALQLVKSPEGAIRLHSALLGGGKAADAERMAADWRKEFPKDAAFSYYLGDVALSQNKLALAEANYRAVLEVQPQNALAMNNVAWLMVKQGKPGAVDLAQKAVALASDKAALRDTLATAQEADNLIPQAIESQKRAVALAPKDASLSLHLARLYIKQGDKPRARAELEALEKLGDGFAGQAEVASLLKSL